MSYADDIYCSLSIQSRVNHRTYGRMEKFTTQRPSVVELESQEEGSRWYVALVDGHVSQLIRSKVLGPVGSRRLRDGEELISVSMARLWAVQDEARLGQRIVVLTAATVGPEVCMITANLLQLRLWNMVLIL